MSGPVSRAAVRGQAAVDYLLVVALVAVAVGIGRSSAVQAFLAALVEHYAGFTWAMSLP